MMVSNDGGFADAAWEPVAATKDWQLSMYDAAVIPRTVYVRYRVSGGESPDYVDDIILDTAAPTGSVSIVAPEAMAAAQGLSPKQVAEGAFSLAMPLSLRLHRLGYQRVTLELEASDDVSGVVQMRVGDDATFADASWVPYGASHATWARSTGGVTVYAQFRDRAGNESEVYSATN